VRVVSGVQHVSVW